jgi:hypothetical protein
VRKHPLTKALWWSGIQACIKVLSQFSLVKVIALWFGPPGMALAGQFQNILYLLQTLGGSATQNSSIQAYNQIGLSPESRSVVLSVSLRISISISVILAALWVLGYPLLGGTIFPYGLPWWLYFLLPVSCFLSAFFFWANSYLSATKNYRLLAFHNIQQTLWTTSLFIAGGHFWGLNGACAGLAIAQIPVALHSIRWMNFRFGAGISIRELWSFRSLLRKAPYPIVESIKSPWPVIGLALYSVAATQFTLVAVRTIMIAHYPLEQVGYWEGLQRIGNLWVPVIATILASHFLPILSCQEHREGFLRHSIQTALSSGGLVMVFALCLMVFRFQAIPMLLSKDFGPMLMILPLQLIADILKAANWGLSHAVMAKGQSKNLIIADLIFQGTLLGGVAFGALNFDWAFAVQAYAAATALHCVLTLALWLRVYRLLPRQIRNYP